MRIAYLWNLLVAVSLSCISLGSVSAAAAESASPAAKLPDGVNAILTIDVAKLAASPWGKQNNLEAKLAAKRADRPLALPANARRLAIGALLNPVGMDIVWQTAVIELSSTPKLQPLVQAQGGYLDQVGGKQAAWTPSDTFFIALDEHTLGVARPGQRQLVHRWIAGNASRNSASPYVASALKAGGDDAAAVFAVDLDGAIGRMAIQYALDMGQVPSLEKVEDDPAKLITALASVTGATITVRAADQLNAECVIDFAQDVSALGTQAGPFLKDVLSLADQYEPEMDKWDFKVQGKKIVGKRSVDEQGLSRLVSILAPPPVQDEAVAATGPSEKSEDAKAAAARASQQYYRAVAKRLDAIGPTPSPTQTAGSLQLHAKSIRQLPMLNVDPELLDWGNSISDALSRAGQELALGQQRAKVASQGVASPTAYSIDTSAGGANSTPEARAAYRNAQQQRRQASQAERGAAAERAFAIINQVLPSSGKVRADMTQKYGVEF